MSEIVDKFETLATLAATRDALRRKALGHAGKPIRLDNIIADPDLLLRSELEIFLGSIPTHVVYGLLALYFSGRDSDPNAVDVWLDYRKGYPTKELAIDGLIGRSLCAAMIREGIALLPLDVALDEVPGRIACQRPSDWRIVSRPHF